MITLWTDGSASPNPGPGGFAVIRDNNPVALGKESDTTNIRMEAMALIAAFSYAKQQQAEGNVATTEKFQICTDSEFWINVLTKWAEKWKADGWTKKNGKIKNLDLVKELHELYLESNNVELKWVRGHIGTEMNELADEWANKARKGETL